MWAPVVVQIEDNSEHLHDSATTHYELIIHPNDEKVTQNRQMMAD